MSGGEHNTDVPASGRDRDIATTGHSAEPQLCLSGSLLPGLHRSPPYLNPLCGPIYIEGAERGDIVVVDIHDIEPQGQGVSVTIQGFGPLADSASWSECHGPFTRILSVQARHQRKIQGRTNHIQ